MLGAELHGEDRSLRGVAALESADPQALAWFGGRRLPVDCAAGVLLTDAPREGFTCLVVDHPLRAFGQLLRALLPPRPVPGSVKWEARRNSLRKSHWDWYKACRTASSERQRAAFLLQDSLE